MKLSRGTITASGVLIFCGMVAGTYAASTPQDTTRNVVGGIIRPIMAKYRIPGMEVGIVAGGKSRVFDYGVASIATGKPVTKDTLFELGSVSKTLTATLASYAQVRGDLSLSDATSKYLTVLRGSPFGEVSLLELGTHTPGGLPLQVPDNVRDNGQLMQYLRRWRPAYKPGSYRTYNNIGIGLLGVITAKSMGENFTTLMQSRLFRALGMTSTYIDVPMNKMADYAEGYTSAGAPIRMSPGVLASEAYGVRSTAGDMVRFLKANMNMVSLNGQLRRAVTDTHIGYFQAGVLTQDLIWEQYPYPVALKTLLQGNSSAMIFQATPVKAIMPPEKSREDVWINKTGSTNGFAAYVAFIPGKQLGIAILANKNYPIDARVTAAYEILTAIAKKP